MSVKKLNTCKLKWVIYMSKNIFCLIKICALISNSLFYRDDLLTFSLAVNTQCQSNMASMKKYCAHIRRKIIDISTEMSHLYVHKYILLV